MTPEQRRRAGRAIATRIAEMTATPTTIARAAGVSARTLRAVISGERWPTDAVQDQLEAVLRWRPGEIVVRAVRSGRSLDQLSDAELARELTGRLEARQKREAKLRAGDAADGR